MRPTPAHLLILVTLWSCTPGCAGQQKFSFDGIQLNLPMIGEERASLLVVDQRQPVVDETYPAAFVGTYQTSPDSTETVVTASGRPFAADVSDVVVNAMTRSGFETTVLSVAAGTSHEQALQALKGKAAAHLLLLEILEWQSKTFMNTEVNYQLSLSVYNAQGALKGEGRVKGSDQLPESHADATLQVNQAVQQALEHKLRQLFHEPKVSEAFRRQF